jgi:copper(I)-binding protein
MHTRFASTFAAFAAMMALTLGPGPAAAESAAEGDSDIVVERAWARATPPGAATGSAYLTVTNAGNVADRLLGATTPAAERIEVHEMSVTDGVMRMRPLAEGLAIEPGASAALAPGGAHLMLIGVTEPLVAGETIDLTLTFERAGDIPVTLPIVQIGAPPPTE